MLHFFPVFFFWFIEEKSTWKLQAKNIENLAITMGKSTFFVVIALLNQMNDK